MLVLGIPAGAAINTIAAGGTVFIGEEGLDITAAGAVPGSSLVWYGPGGTISGSPAAQVTVGDPESFYASPASFSGKTGPWFLLPGNSLAFYIKEPSLGIRVVDYSSDFVLGTGSSWLPKGDTAGFRIDTNLWEMSLREGVTGAPLIIRLTGPGGVQFSSVGGYSLVDVPVSSVPFETGPVWPTGQSEYPSGSYTVYVRCDANDISDNNPAPGKAISESVTLLLQKDNPLITRTTAIPPASSPPTSMPTPSATMTALTGTSTTTATAPPTAPQTQATTPTAAPSTTTPGFSAAHAVAGVLAAISLAAAIRRIP